MDRVLGTHFGVYDWTLVGAMTSTPVWLPPLSQVNEVLAFVGFLAGLVLTCMRIGQIMQERKDQDDRKERSKD